MALSDIEGIIELEETQEQETTEETSLSILESYVDFDAIQEFSNIEDETKEIKEIEKIQELEKMYQFVNSEITYEGLQALANKCLMYVDGSSNTEFRRIGDKIHGVKSKPILIDSDEDDFI